jgi:GNAT superfamily N-acetyltransferase
MSFYADYLRENTDVEIVETEDGFATYRYLNENQVYLMDIYVKPDHRCKGVASALANIIVGRAKQRGCTEIIGSVVPTSKRANDSLKVLMAWGMRLMSSNNDLILFKKGI